MESEKEKKKTTISRESSKTEKDYGDYTFPNYKFEMIVSFTAESCEENNITNLVVAERKKKDKEFVWPMEKFDKIEKAAMSMHFES